MDRQKITDLGLRVSKGFDLLFSMEQAWNTGEQYEIWFGRWHKLLWEYEAALDAVGVTG